MKARLLLATAIAGMYSTASAQLYVEAHGAYLLPLGGNSVQSSINEKSKSTLINMGTGAGAGINIGTSLNGTLGVELRATYVSGTQQKVSSRSDMQNSYTSSTNTWQTNYLRIEPALRADMGKGALKYYLAVGPSFALVPTLQLKYATFEETQGAGFPPYYSKSETTGKMDYTGGIGIGGFGAFGVTWSRGILGAFLEVQATGQTWAPTKGKGRSQTITQQTGSWTTTDEEIFNIDYVGGYSSGEKKAPLTHLVMSTWGGRCGVRFTFGGKQKKAPAAPQG